jgi:hypothetical protein
MLITGKKMELRFVKVIRPYENWDERGQQMVTHWTKPETLLQVKNDWGFWEYVPCVGSEHAPRIEGLNDSKD